MMDSQYFYTQFSFDLFGSNQTILQSYGEQTSRSEDHNTFSS